MRRPVAAVPRDEPMRRLSKSAASLVTRARAIIFPSGVKSIQTEGMLRLERWLVEEPEGKPAVPSLHSALAETFAHFAHGKPPVAATAIDSAVVLDDGTGHPWTVRIHHGKFSLEAGRSRDAETTITSDPLTLAGIVRGKRSGIEPLPARPPPRARKPLPRAEARRRVRST